jgi:SAM-dependent methyltransferase
MELKAFYERSYTRGGDNGGLYAEWRALSAVTKVDNVLSLAPSSLGGQAARVLDIGCGDGAVIAELGRRRAEWSYAGVEIAERAVELAAGRCPDADIRWYDGGTLPFAAGDYELAIVSHVLEHVIDPVSVLSEAARVATHVVLEVPLEDNLSARRAAKRGIADDVGHIQRFSREAIEAMVRRAGLRVAAERFDPLHREVHTFFTKSAAARARGNVKWLVRKLTHDASPALAQRLFTLHYACLCEPATTRR